MSPSSDIEKQENTAPRRCRKAGENVQSIFDMFVSIDYTRLCILSAPGAGYTGKKLDDTEVRDGKRRRRGRSMHIYSR